MSKNVQYCPLCGGKNVKVNRLPRDEDVWHYPSANEDGDQLNNPVELECDDCSESLLITDFD